MALYVAEGTKLRAKFRHIIENEEGVEVDIPLDAIVTVGIAPVFAKNKETGEDVEYISIEYNGCAFWVTADGFEVASPLQ